MKPIACMLAVIVLLGSAFARDNAVEKGAITIIVLQDVAVSENFKQAFIYQLTVQVGCTEYTGLFTSPQNNLMAQFAAGDELEVRVGKQTLVANVPGLDEMMQIRLLSKRNIDQCQKKK